MQNITEHAPTVTEAPKVSVVARLRNRIAGVFAMLSALFVVVPSAAHATVPDTDLTGGAGDTFFTSLTDYFTGNVIGPVLVLAALMVGVGLLIAWGRKGARSGG